MIEWDNLLHALVGIAIWCSRWWSSIFESRDLRSWKILDSISTINFWRFYSILISRRQLNELCLVFFNQLFILFNCVSNIDNHVLNLLWDLFALILFFTEHFNLPIRPKEIFLNLFCGFSCIVLKVLLFLKKLSFWVSCWILLLPPGFTLFLRLRWKEFLVRSVCQYFTWLAWFNFA